MKIITRNLLILLVVIVVPLTNTLLSQDSIVLPQFTSFKGTVYKMPLVERQKGRIKTKSILKRYDESVYQYEKYDNIELAEINVPETDIATGKFPGIGLKRQFCMVLYSKMTISQAGCYEFELNSDDGSILWINDVIAVDNDGDHQMSAQKDTLKLAEGEYDIKLWYFQGLPDRFGFEFKSNYVMDGNQCKALDKKEKLELETEILFASGKYELNQEAMTMLKNKLSTYSDKSITSIKVYGHTDDVGSSADNKELSQRRANSIGNAVQQILNLEEKLIESIGKGEEEFKVANDSEKARAANRRVEIVISYSN